MKPQDIDAGLAKAARAFIAKNAIVGVGAIVETTWGNWKRPQRVRINHVGAHLVCRWNEERKDWIAGFAMEYYAERLSKDGTSKERNEGGGICLSSFTTMHGEHWAGAPSGTYRERHEEAGFNHCGLSWGTSRTRRTGGKA